LESSCLSIDQPQELLLDLEHDYSILFGVGRISLSWTRNPSGLEATRSCTIAAKKSALAILKGFLMNSSDQGSV